MQHIIYIYVCYIYASLERAQNFNSDYKILCIYEKTKSLYFGDIYFHSISKLTSVVHCSTLTHLIGIYT